MRLTYSVTMGSSMSLAGAARLPGELLAEANFAVRGSTGSCLADARLPMASIVFLEFFGLTVFLLLDGLEAAGCWVFDCTAGLRFWRDPEGDL